MAILFGDLGLAGGETHCDATWPVGRSDAAFGNQSPEGECRFSFPIGLIPATLSGSRHVLQWPSKFFRTPVESSLEGGAYACSGIIDHMTPSSRFYEPLQDRYLGAVDFGNCESLRTHGRITETATDENAARRFLGSQQALGNEKSDNVYWLPGTRDPADGLAKAECEMVPL